MSQPSTAHAAASSRGRRRGRSAARARHALRCGAMAALLMAGAPATAQTYGNVGSSVTVDYGVLDSLGGTSANNLPGMLSGGAYGQQAPYGYAQPYAAAPYAATPYATAPYPGQLLAPPATTPRSTLTIGQAGALGAAPAGDQVIRLIPPSQLKRVPAAAPAPTPAPAPAPAPAQAATAAPQAAAAPVPPPPPSPIEETPAATPPAVPTPEPPALAQTATAPAAPAIPEPPQPAEPAQQAAVPPPEPPAPEAAPAPEPAPAPAAEAASEPAPEPTPEPTATEAAPPAAPGAAAEMFPPAGEPDAEAPDVEASVAEEPAAETPAAEPADTQTAALPPQAMVEGQVSIGFPEGGSELTAEARSALDEMAGRLRDDEALRVQLLAYAKAIDDNTSRARRMSLSRALAVRAYLIEKGVRSTRMDVRALGSNVEGEPADRVDIIPQAQ